MSRHTERRPLTKLQRNQVLELIVRVSLDPHDFAWTERPTWDDGSGDITPLITHVPSGYYFHFGFSSSSLVGRWSPPLRGVEIERGFHDWDALAEVFFAWLHLVKADVDAPDMWAALTAEQAITKAGQPEGDNRPFDSSEIRELEKRLAELKSFLETRYVQESDRAQLTSRFRYLIEAARRGLGRIDWLNIFIAQMLAMVMAGVIPSTAWGDAMRMAATLFHSLIAALKALGT